MRITSISTRLGFAISLVFATTALGCGDDSSRANDADVQTATAAGQNRGQTLGSEASADINASDDQTAIEKTASILRTINNGEIQEAQTVMDLTVDEEIDDFATTMIQDHTALNAQLDAFLLDRNLAPKDTAVSVALTEDTAANLRELKATDLNQIGRIYFRMEVQGHQEALVIVDSLMDVDKDTELDSFLGRTRDLISDHLKSAIDHLRNQ